MSSLTVERVRLVLLLLLILAAFSFLVALARARDRVAGLPRTLQEPPEDIHPVELALLWSAYRHHLSPRTAYRTAIIHLARIGAIRLSPVGLVSDPTDFTIYLAREPGDDIDAEFVDFLFDGRGPSDAQPISLRSLRMRGQATNRLVVWWDDAYARVSLGIQRIFVDTRLELILAFVIGVLATPIAVATLGPDFAQLGGLRWAVITVGALGWLVTAWVVPAHLPRDLRVRLQVWLAFRRHLKEFTSLRDAPAEGIVIWERYLAYAAALGVADRIRGEIHGLNATSRLPAPWHGAPEGSVGASWLAHVWKRGPVRAPALDQMSGRVRA
jgi:hypothetical protein